MPRICFIHPDLGIGGAEKAMVDAALALKNNGHQVEFITSHHSPDHCFAETRDGTFKVTVVGDWLPRSILGRCYALCAYLRMIYAAMYLVAFCCTQFDLIFCDQISACIPILKLSRLPIVFYCHFPDMLLTQRNSLLKKLYRWPIDWLEEVTTGRADKVLVNSKFTAGVFKETFSRLSHITPEVVYPIPNVEALEGQSGELNPDWQVPKASTIFLSINRYERKKNLELAIEALGKVAESVGHLQGKVHLIIAGGYDDRVVENKEYYLELRALASRRNLQEYVTFVRSFNASEKISLLNAATCLLYTPDREHFGIVPVEAMYMKCPVIAVSSGGPLETVLHEHTGYLCEQTNTAFAKAMLKFVADPNIRQRMGETGKSRMIELFSFETYSNQLNNIIMSMLKS
ncbi:alpha-1,3/1,6-mannosyltransferase ALG2-like [Watersipora subatra]|uniref:alpha-1,3/1,6-mannosyltransferase ALG2-like n=1 Tax=Watersipora subatra TaxID=2589382 RepID=UPI00355BC321